MKAEGAAKMRRSKPRILVVTPEITYLPSGMGNMANRLSAKAGGLADVSASLVAALFNLGADVHVALPHYRRMFNVDIGRFFNEELRKYKSVLPDSRIHLAQDRVFYYRDQVYSNYDSESIKVALAFQREVINNIIPKVNPDLVHCNDWMTGLVPGMARRINIPSLFTIHNIHTRELTLAGIEESGIDAAEFWLQLYYTKHPGTYEQTRNHIPVDFLASGIFAGHFVNTVSPTFLREVCEGQHRFIPDHIRAEMSAKTAAGCGFGILNSPDPSFDPVMDDMIETHYTPETHVQGKRENKLRLQERLGLLQDPDAALMFWPSRLDPVQKGCQLLSHILYDVVSTYWRENLQIVFVANGPYKDPFHNIVRFHNMYERVAVCDFDEELSRMGYAASDFMLMPSLFEPCGLPQMISALYGSLPIVNDTGGLHDTVEHMDVEANAGNGFVFNTWNSEGLRWAIDQAMAFYRRPGAEREQQVKRVMQDATRRFTHSVTAQSYIDLYEQILQRPLIQTF